MAEGNYSTRRVKTTGIFQYVDDSSFMNRGERRYVDEFVYILRVFNAASVMEIN